MLGKITTTRHPIFVWLKVRSVRVSSTPRVFLFIHGYKLFCEQESIRLILANLVSMPAREESSYAVGGLLNPVAMATTRRRAPLTRFFGDHCLPVLGILFRWRWSCAWSLWVLSEEECKCRGVRGSHLTEESRYSIYVLNTVPRATGLHLYREISIARLSI
jgi:hypothetical protein